MTRPEWIAAFAARYAGLAGTSLPRARLLAMVVLEGSGPPGGDQNLHSDPEAMADEHDAKERDG
jgi:hypothetical protein